MFDQMFDVIQILPIKMVSELENVWSSNNVSNNV